MSSEDLLEAILKAAGGLERFNKIDSIEVDLVVSGQLFHLKGHPGPYGHRRVSIVFEPKQLKLSYLNLDGKEDGLWWRWTPNMLWKESADGSVVESRKAPFTREAFKGHELFTLWDDLHLLYFSGYAMMNYLSTPFMFTWPGFTTKEIESHHENGQQWRVLEVTFPEEFDTHGPVQKFYFDDKFRLRRLDYAAEVIGRTRSTPAAHYCFDHREIDGLVFPMLRRVVSIPTGIENGGEISMSSRLELASRISI